MDLGTHSWRPDPGEEGALAPAAVMLAVAAARQAASPTAQANAHLPAPRERTAAAFAEPVAQAIARWGRARCG